MRPEKSTSTRRPNTFPSHLGLAERRTHWASELVLLVALLPALAVVEGFDLVGQVMDGMRRRRG